MKGYFRFGKKDIPDFIVEKNNVIFLIIFTTVFSLLFVNVYRPFNSTEWLPSINSWLYFIYSSLLVVIGMGTISISRLIMHFFIGKQKSISQYGYFLWVLAEIFILSMFYVLIGLWLLPAEKLSWSDMNTIFDAFKKAMANTTLMLLIPYSMVHLLLSNNDLHRRLNESSQMSETRVIQFKDERGEARFSVKIENVIFLESADNYVIIKYLSKGAVSEFFIRNSLKRILDDLEDTPIVRCHRSYMVNFEHVTSLTQRNNELWIDFDIKEIKEIPVSKMMAKSVTEAFMKYSNKH